jgi:hypothetical protein
LPNDEGKNVLSDFCALCGHTEDSDLQRAKATFNVVVINSDLSIQFDASPALYGNAIMYPSRNKGTHFLIDTKR